MNLVRAELERLTARRFVQLMVLLLAVAFAVTTATTLLGSHRPTTSEMSAAQTQAARAVAAMEAEHTRCLQIKAGEIPIIKDGEYVPADCAELDPARMAQLPLATDYLSSVFVFSHEARGLLYFLIAFLVLFAFLVGASYIGADLNSGGVVNLLLWRPGRLTVLGTKLGTLVGVVAALSVLSSALYLGTFWTIGQTAGLPGPLDGEFWGQLGAIYGRGLVLVLLAAVLGFGIATLGRHTSAALGAVAAYAVVWEVGCRLVLQIIDVARPDQLMLSTYLGAWLSGKVELWDGNGCPPGGGVCDGGLYTITWAPALLVLLALTGAVAGAAFAAFRRRDLL
ncbi:ABC-2 family transporter protein [Micromonospora matsumotoense]|uniref:ABC-2 family transporter protein n=1 Tax=Micromonospora matsumotoense TaxID=121616 RepID=A0A1C4YB54_9ACTN|nr:ABC transporter permease subunit [Micromonospora matsumotoense]SCF17982.1 ABC-2 family transporter protein [Micromonospora matsumotoense]